ncbi:MAG: hypothetical protein RR911_05745 [Oscillospiraceae bacterium]
MQKQSREMSSIKKDFLSKVDTCAISKSDLEKINKLTRKEQTAESVYIFNVVLCDNEIDRDFERFSIEALNALAPMFVGKTGILDHNMKSDNQVARIFETRVETELYEKTRAGEPLTKLVARAYMAKTNKNADLITEIDAGIKKEVSVGCAVSSVKCSLCGQDRRQNPCNHMSGKSYAKALCHSVLSGPTDAYEWSFVAVPAQVGAGVTKAFNNLQAKGEQKVESIIEIIKSANADLVITKGELDLLKGEISELKEKAKDGEMYKTALRSEVLKMCAATMPQMNMQTFESMLLRASASELSELKVAFSQKMAEQVPPTVQLIPSRQKQKTTNSQFKI